MADIAELKERIKFRKSALRSLRAAYLALAEGGVQSYAIGSRNLTRLDLEKLAREIKQTELEIDQLESQVQGGGVRKAFGVLPRDW